MTGKTPHSGGRPARIRISVDRVRDRSLLRRLRAAAPDIDLVKPTTYEAPPELVLIAREEYDNLIEALEDKEAAAAHTRTAGEERVPLDLARRLASGDNPIRLWREYRGMTLDALGAATGLSKGYLSDLERGQRAGPVDTLRAIARALKVDLEDLTAPPGG